LADDDFNSYDYQETQVRVEGWGLGEGVTMWQRTGDPVADGDPVYLPILDILAVGTRERRIALARCSRPLPPDILKALAQDEDVAVRYWVTRRDQDLPPEVLQTLAQDGDVDVRYWLTQRDQDQPPQILQTLAQDESVFVRYGITGRDQYLPPWLCKLSHGIGVSMCAIGSPSGTNLYRTRFCKLSQRMKMPRCAE
jgi:hypothetical protein